MTLAPGQSFEGPDGRQTEVRTAAEAVSPGDAVALNSNGEVVTADGTDDPDVYGVVNDLDADAAAGEVVGVTYRGSVVASVTAGTAAGAVLGASATEGQLAAGSNYKGITAQYSEGANPSDAPEVPSGFAHVEL